MADHKSAVDGLGFDALLPGMGVGGAVLQRPLPDCELDIQVEIGERAYSAALHEVEGRSFFQLSSVWKATGGVRRRMVVMVEAAATSCKPVTGLCMGSQ